MLIQMIENLAKATCFFGLKPKAWRKKDMQVTFDFEGTVDGEKFEGGSAGRL